MANNIMVGFWDPLQARKGWVAVAGAVITVTITALQQLQPFMSEQWIPLVVGVTTLLTSVAVYFVPNKRVEQ